MSVRRALLLLLAAPASICALAGCGGKQLETGYTFTPLGDSPAQRRAYYAGPFSPEARNAMISEQREGGSGPSRRPNP